MKINKKHLIENSLKDNYSNLDPRILKVFDKPKLEPGHVFIAVSGEQISIINNHPQVDGWRFKVFSHFLLHVIKKYNLNLNFKFILNTHDEPSSGSFPVFSFCNSKNFDSNITVPDPHLIDRYLNKTIKDEIKTENKLNSFVFRGSDTGIYPRATKNERIYICNLLKNSKMFDVKISKFINYSQDSLKYFGFKIEDLMGDFLSPFSQLKHKYILDINGNTAAWDRNCWVLGSNSILIKVQTKTESDETWYSKYLDVMDIVPRVFPDELFNLNIDEDLYLSKQQLFSKILLNSETHEEYLEKVLIRYDREFNK